MYRSTLGNIKLLTIVTMCYDNSINRATGGMANH